MSVEYESLKCGRIPATRRSASDPDFQIQFGAVGESKAQAAAREFRMFQFLCVQLLQNITHDPPHFASVLSARKKMDQDFVRTDFQNACTLGELAKISVVVAVVVIRPQRSARANRQSCRSFQSGSGQRIRAKDCICAVIFRAAERPSRMRTISSGALLRARPNRRNVFGSMEKVSHKLRALMPQL